MSNNKFIPASLRIGKMHSILDSLPMPKPSTDDLVRMVNNRYADYLKNQVDWEHNDTRDLILKMKIAIEQLAAERDAARQEVCQWEHHWDKTSSEQYYADKRGWDCYKEDGK